MINLTLFAGNMTIADSEYNIISPEKFTSGDIVYIHSLSEDRPKLFLELLTGLARFTEYRGSAEPGSITGEKLSINGLELFEYKFSKNEVFRPSFKDNEIPVDLDFATYRAQKIGIVFGEPKQYTLGSTVREEILYSFKAAGIQKTPDLLPFKKYGLYPILDNPTSGLSGGESHRLNIACVIELGCPVIILDLSAANLDLEFKSELKKIFKEISDERIIFLYDSVKTDFVDVCNKCLQIQNGKVSCSDISTVRKTLEARSKINIRDRKTESPILEIESLHIPMRTEPFSVSLNRYDAYVVTGRNGIGKTTVTRFLAGIESAYTSGRILYPKGSKRIVCSFQYPVSMPIDTTIEKLDYHNNFSKIYPDIDRHLKVCYLDLSKQKLLYLISIIALDAEIFVLDEPFACMDFQDMIELASVINREKKKTFLIFNHEQIVISTNKGEF